MGVGWGRRNKAAAGCWWWVGASWCVVRWKILGGVLGGERDSAGGGLRERLGWVGCVGSWWRWVDVGGCWGVAFGGGGGVWRWVLGGRRCVGCVVGGWWLAGGG